MVLTDSERDLLLRVAACPPGEPYWLREGENPGPMLSLRRAGLVVSDVFAVTATAEGRMAAAATDKGAAP